MYLFGADSTYFISELKREKQFKPGNSSYFSYQGLRDVDRYDFAVERYFRGLSS